MSKTYEQIEKDKQKHIQEAIKNKEKRLTKTELSIQISWAINNASNFLPQDLKGTQKGFKMIKKWYPEFIELYREWMLDNMPKPEELYPQQTYIQEKETEWKDEIIKEEEIRRANEEFIMNQEIHNEENL